MKKFFVFILAIIVLLTLPACSAIHTNGMVEAGSAGDKSVNCTLDDKAVDVCLTMEDYEYVAYGDLVYIHTLIGNNNIAVCAFEPIQSGGKYYDDYGWDTVFVNVETLKNIDRESHIDEKGVTHWSADYNTHYYRLTMRNCEDAGGFIALPSFITNIEVIDVGDIPSWGV